MFRARRFLCIQVYSLRPDEDFAIGHEMGRGVVSLKKERGVSARWPWPDSLDALTAASGFHRLLFENAHVRVLEVRIGPGQFVPVHTHRWPSVVYAVSGSYFIRRDGEGKLLFDSRTMGELLATPATQ
jgi:hypothetical protein